MSIWSKKINTDGHDVVVMGCIQPSIPRMNRLGTLYLMMCARILFWHDLSMFYTEGERSMKFINIAQVCKGRV